MSQFLPERLGEDLAVKPAMFEVLAAQPSPWTACDLDPAAIDRVLLLGMGSSYFAADVAARRLRGRGVNAVAERASTAASWPASPRTLVVAISAGGSSIETLHAVAPYVDSAARYIVLSNTPSGRLATESLRTGGTVIDLEAGVEVSGVSARSYAATLVRLLQLEELLVGRDLRLPDRLVAAAAACADLLEGGWVDDAIADLVGPSGTWLLAPSERLSSALQGALMLRETPRRLADGCETGDWSHVDVYLTKTYDYRAIMFAGSRWDAAAADWMTQRGSTFWTVGGVGAPIDGAKRSLRFHADDDPMVALLAELTVPELIAARLPVG